MLQTFKNTLLGIFLAASPLAAANDITSSEPETINTLDYFISDHQDKGLTGSHAKSQKVQDNTSYYTKWADNAYEIHSWDEDYIYLREDHSWKYDQGYAFGPGRWMRRQMKIGEAISEQNNQGHYFSTATCNLEQVTPLPYTMTLENRITNYKVGGDLGRQDVIVLKYDYSTPAHPQNFERFYYSKEWGWIKWELYENAKLKQTSIFNKITDSPLVPDMSTSCTRGGATASNVPVVYSLPNFKIMTGKAVRTLSDATVYYIRQDGKREYVCDTRLLSAYGLEADNLELISLEDLKFYPPLTFVRTNNGAVYKLQGQHKHMVRPAIFQKYSIAFESLPLIGESNLPCYKTGPALN